MATPPKKALKKKKAHKKATGGKKAAPTQAKARQRTPAKKRARAATKTPAKKRAAKAKRQPAKAKQQKAVAKPRPARAKQQKAVAKKPTPKKTKKTKPAKPAKAAPAKRARAGPAPAAKAPPAPAAPTPKKARAKSSLLERKVPPRKPGSVICSLSGFEVMPTTPNLAPRTLERLRRRLNDERERHHRQAEELRAEAEALAMERDPGDTQFDEESGEGDTVNVERERDLVLSATAQQIVEAIDRALARMDAGTYGLCVPASRRIALERLEAIPYAEECVDCKARAERRR